MQVVINIDDEKYERLAYLDTISLKSYIENGIVLPKGHGRLGDLDRLKQKIEMGDDDIMEEDWYKLYDNVISNIDNAHAIIEADRSEEE